MAYIEFPIGKRKMGHDFSGDNLTAVLESKLEEYIPSADEDTLVKNAVMNPTGTKRLSELSKGKNNVVIIASDHTRPVPSKIIMPYMLREVRKGNPDADITILIATGFHRETTREELIAKFGEEIIDNEKIVVHISTDDDMMTEIGTLPSGGRCRINKIAANADLLIAEGFIEPHFFAGYSGGRKSVLPGVCSKETVLANHCAEFIASPYSRTGILEHNLIHEDMVWAARKANLAFIVNVVINSKKEVVFAVAGDVEAAHKKGTDFLSKYCGAFCDEADIVVSTNGGYPLDQNIYQSVKGMTAAEAAVKKGGIIIMLSSANDGTGGDDFYHAMKNNDSADDIYNGIMKRDRNETEPDQWMVQILARILKKAQVIYVSDCDSEIVKGYHFIPEADLDSAIKRAKEMIKKTNPTIVAIPEGISVVVNGN